MSTNLQDITLQSTDGMLHATNTAGHLTYPMLFRHDTPDPENLPVDLQQILEEWENVLIFVDGKTTLPVVPGNSGYKCFTNLHKVYSYGNAACEPVDSVGSVGQCDVLRLS